MRSRIERGTRMLYTAAQDRIAKARYALRWLALRGPRAASREISTLWKTRVLLRLLPQESARILAIHLVLGMTCGLVAVAFHGTLQASSALVARLLASVPSPVSIALLLVLPAGSAALAGVLLVRSGLPAAGSGIPQVKAALHHRLAYPGIATGALKFGLCLLQIGGGASLGREGPTVQISASFVPRFLRVFALPRKMVDRFVPVAAAAGIAAAFNTPIAAVTFTMEEMMGSSTPTAMTGLVLAAAVAAIEEKLFLGGYPLFHVPGWSFGGLASLPSFLLLGICGGYAGVMFHRGLLWLRTRFQLLPVDMPMRMALGGLATGIAAAIAWGFLGSRGIAGPGYALLDSSLGHKLSITQSVWLMVLKFGATLGSYSSGGVGGIFSPVLSIGALLGSAIGQLQAAFPWSDSTPAGAFALVGMGTFFASVIQAPITSVLIIFELTGNYGLVIPLMLANTASFLLARRMNPVPIYDALLLQDGIDLEEKGDEDQPRVSDLSVRDFHTADAESKVSEFVRSEGRVPCVLLNPDGTCAGILETAPAAEFSDSKLRDRVDSRATLREIDPAFPALALLSDEGRRWVPVVDSSGRPVALFGSSEALALLANRHWTVEEID